MDVTTDEKMNFVSSIGYAIGYWGRCLPYIISLILYATNPFNNVILEFQIAIAITAVWWLVFTIPMLKNVKQVYGSTENPKNLIARSFQNVWTTMKKISTDKKVLLFLIAYFFYIDGVNTLITMSTDYGYDVGINQTQMALALLATQIIAAPSVMLFERLAKFLSTKIVIMFSIVLFTAICIYAFFMTHNYQFWIMAIAAAFGLGTIQALSRSFFGQILPNKNSNNEYFGFITYCGRYSSILGPLMLSIFTIITGQSKYGVLSIVVLFIIGFIVFIFIPDIDRRKSKEII